MLNVFIEVEQQGGTFINRVTGEARLNSTLHERNFTWLFAMLRLTKLDTDFPLKFHVRFKKKHYAVRARSNVLRFMLTTWNILLKKLIKIWENPCQIYST